MRYTALVLLLSALLLLSGCQSSPDSAPAVSSEAYESPEAADPKDIPPLAPGSLPDRTERVEIPETANAEFTLTGIDLPNSVRNPIIYGDSHPLIWYTDESGKWGACDWNGTVLFPCQYDDVAQFCADGVAAVKKDGLYGYVNIKGEEVLPCQFASVTQLHDKILLAGDGSTPYTVYDLEGHALGTLPAGVNARNTCGGLIQYFDESAGFYGYLNSDGSVAIPAAFIAVYPVTSGLAAVQEPVTGKKGFLDLSGQWVVAPQYDIVRSGYVNGYAVVGIAAEDPIEALRLGGYGLIDTAGNPASNTDYLDICPFSDGWAAYYRDSSRGYLDKNNVEHDLSSLLQDGYTPYSFSDGYAVYTTQSGLSGYLDSKLRIAVPAQFYSCSSVIDGHALVEQPDGTFCLLILKS